MNLIFLSSDPISLPSLEELANGKISGIRITAVVTNPDRRSGRGKKIQRNVVAAKAEELGLPVLQTSKLTTDQCRSLPEFDAALVYAFGQILPRSVLSLKPNRFLNIHASPLPRLRGPSPIETAIAEGWMTTEISLMRMVLRMDAGDVAHRQTVEITRTDTGRSLREKIAHVSASLVHRIPEALSDEAHWERQVDSNATWCRKISKQDASLDLSLPATVLADRARAFSGWPGSTLQIHGEVVKVSGIEADTGNGYPGEVLQTDEVLEIATGLGSIKISQIQRPSRKMIPFPEFQRTHPLTKGTVLGFVLSTPLVRHTQAL
mgnify:CR=1 FL=1|tara:strand:- start:16688 stop:17647 length:960 start_codon:yes stop_codon:yes gene_type:complete